MKFSYGNCGRPKYLITYSLHRYWISRSTSRLLKTSPSGEVCNKTYSTISETSKNVLKTRNIGIIAHIDAGKTTTTERMLYYSGHTRSIGDVDDGSTVTDFLPAERARGITIQSAAITFEWPPETTGDSLQALQIQDNHENTTSTTSQIPHRINLIDTPGHADFTFEVRRSLRVLDGAICILDGVAGVEAQTEQVWTQAGEWKIPRIAYINKLDRDGAAFGRTVREIGLRLQFWPVLCQIPWFEGGRGRFTGIGDAVNLLGLRYEAGSDGKEVRRHSLVELDNIEPHLALELRRARIALIERLSEFDDVLVEEFFEANEDHLAVSPEKVLRSLRRTLLQVGSRIVPVFAGASFRNIGVQPLLDAVNDLLPSPAERPDPEISIGQLSGSMRQLMKGELASSGKHELTKPTKKDSQNAVASTVSKLSGCALAFKVVSDPRKGVLVYIRVYSGSINRNDLLFNTNLQKSERATNLLQMYASESVAVQSIEAGQIGVVAGSKHARTGDTLISYSGNRANPPEPLNTLQLRPIHIPPPVFFAAIEPKSLRDERDMHEKLALLLREDPSLHVTQDEDTGQTLISGMGELHLEIARDRLVKDFRANANMGKITIGYREVLTEPSDKVSKVFDKDRGDAKGRAGCTAQVSPVEDRLAESIENDGNSIMHEQDGNIIIVKAPTLDTKGRSLDENAASLPAHLSLQEVQTAYINGALAALSRGPTYSYPMRKTTVMLTLDPSVHIFGSETTTSTLTAAARLATIGAFRNSTSKSASSLMEPVMNVDISVDEGSLGNVIQDISSSRGGHIVSLGDGEDAGPESNEFSVDIRKIYTPQDPFESGMGIVNPESQPVKLQRKIKARVPLKEMVGYLKHLRSMTGGRGTFVMNVDRFEKMTGQREKALLAELRGG